MNKPYSTKALPAGTVLREWQLEQVLGVGGFGIVYKGRGIYFDELVAIKEYFPSAISERRDGDTVVPIDSDAEELHALGLKKFVEEAKLLWNLSTPTRHPNIVSVRSLFEIHGTAYMVMDFEDGVSLSRAIKDGKKFTEEELLGLVRPIGEGLDRAHRVGVLHRDIKPPNILINEDGRPVLIDFGSARFDAGQATSTTVTFHTPPYAAIEQYVKTYEQGPWTDIYALGVVLYECVTGEKPPEVLERLHGGLGKNLADGDWPGFSERTLRAIDAAMTIRPDSRPQSIGEWLRMFDEDYQEPVPEPEFDEDATQVSTFHNVPPPIIPIDAPREGVEQLVNSEPPVPDTTSKARFKLVNGETGAWPRRAGEAVKALLDGDAEPPKEPDAEVKAGVVEPVSPKSEAPAAETPAVAKTPTAAKADKTDKPRKDKGGVRPALIAGVAAGAIAIFVGGFFWAQQNSAPAAPVPLSAPSVSAGGVDITAVSKFSEDLLALAKEARDAGAGASLSKPLDDAASQLTGDYEALAVLAAEGGSREEIEAGMDKMRGFAGTTLTSLGKGLLSAEASRSRQLARDAAWTDPAKPSALNAKGATEKKIVSQMAQARTALGDSAAAISKAQTFEEGLAASRKALSDYGRFATAASQASRLAARDKPETALTGEPTAVAKAPVVQDGPFNPAPKISQFDAIAASAKDIGQKVIAMGSGKKPGSRASDEEKANYDLRKDNADRAKDYIAYIDKLSGDIRQAESAAVANDVIAQGNKYKGYLVVLLSRSSAAMD